MSELASKMTKNKGNLANLYPKGQNAKDGQIWSQKLTECPVL